jgi:hypothetical protein
MTELSNNADPSRAAPGDPQDTLGRLYRMSKTAGLGSSDYQAVNVPSVMALVLGLASFLANFDPILLVVPLTAIVIGIVAIVQIRRSNGTQIGLPMAGLGIVLAIGRGVWAGTARAREAARTAQDRAELIALVDRFSEAVRTQRFEEAYSLLSETFQERVPRARFDEPWQYYAQNAKLKSLASNGLFNFEVDDVTRIRVASGQLIITFDSGQTAPDRPTIVFSNRGQGWKIENLPQFYPLRSPDGTTASPGR